MSQSTVVVEVQFGPVCRSALDVLELAGELLDLLPEWHAAEREELESRCAALAELMQRTLATRQP